MGVDMGNVGRRTIDCVTFNSVVTIIMIWVICVSNFSKHARVITIIILSRGDCLNVQGQFYFMTLHYERARNNRFKERFRTRFVLFQNPCSRFPLELRTGAWRRQN